MFSIKNTPYTLATLLFPMVAFADSLTASSTKVALIEDTLIIGTRDDARSLTGSAHTLDAEDIRAFQYNDINQILSSVPGVYFRQEDGFGLRPNIGIRGVTSDRSQKVTMMEDGILITPAPYAAPAAYYIPNISRMSSVEVFKGPAAIAYGPHTVGGAINLVTRPITQDMAGEMALSYGNYDQQKYSGWFSDSGETFGYMIEGLRYSSDGFKKLDNGKSTGFERNDINLKFSINSDESATVRQRLLVKLGYADETSQETYLGLSTESFNKDPDRRYDASEKDHFDSAHWQIHALHTALFTDDLTLSTKAYFNHFDRTWFRVSSMGQGAPAIEEILSNPGTYSRLLAIIDGRRDSDRNQDMDTLVLTRNARTYKSMGLETRLMAEFTTGALEHSLNSGLRWHEDAVDRDQPQWGYWMQSGRLVADGKGIRRRDDNRSEARAVALYLNDIMTWGKWTFNLGSRFEWIDSRFTDALDADKNKSRTTTVFIPGAGALYQFTDRLGAFVGINKGFSPAGANADEAVKPEKSINYEYGLRYNQDDLYLEAIGFFSDYSNLVARCGFSETACRDQSLNGGAVHIYGLEVLGNYRWQWQQWVFPTTVSYTLTESAFQTTFDSQFSQWGDVDKGDELPYLPHHQLRVVTAIEALTWDMMFAVNYTSAMREIASRSGNLTYTAYDAVIKPLVTLDFAAGYRFTEQLSAKFSIDNVLNTQHIVSRRPLGARPNKPLSMLATVAYRF